MRRCRIFLPPTDLLRFKNPHFRFFRRMEGWKVRLMSQIQDEKASNKLLFPKLRYGCSRDSVVIWRCVCKMLCAFAEGCWHLAACAICRMRRETSLEVAKNIMLLFRSISLTTMEKRSNQQAKRSQGRYKPLSSLGSARSQNICMSPSPIWCDDSYLFIRRERCGRDIPRRVFCVEEGLPDSLSWGNTRDSLRRSQHNTLTWSESMISCYYIPRSSSPRRVMPTVVSTFVQFRTLHERPIIFINMTPG
jgi:hypothetical protein